MKLVTANELAKKYGAWLVEGKEPQQELEQHRLAEQHIMQIHRLKDRLKVVHGLTR
jgi:hypothetical protein